MKAGFDLAILSCLTLFIFCFTASLFQSLTPLVPGKCSVYSHTPLVYGVSNYIVLPSLLFFPSWPFGFLFQILFLLFQYFQKFKRVTHLICKGRLSCASNNEWGDLDFSIIFDINYLWDLEQNTCIICLDVKFTSAKYGVRKII